MHRPTLPILILLLLFPLSYFGYWYFFPSSFRVDAPASNNPVQESEKNNPSPTETLFPENATDTNSTKTEMLSPSNTNPTPSPETPSPIELSPEKTPSQHVFASITPTHCQNSCEAFSGILPYFEYCQNVCGLSELKKVSADDCKKEKDLRKDYCLKDAALNKKDLSLCQQITDENLKKTCISRLTEDILENTNRSM